VNLSRRSALVFLLLGLSLLLGFLFRSFLLENFIRPVALVFLLLQRTVQSIDQQVYWYVLIGSAVIYLFVRFARTLTEFPPETQAESNVTLDSIHQWRILIPLFDEAADRPNILKQNLGRILTTIYSSRQPDAAHWEVDEALRLRRIALPESIYAFLFPLQPAEEGPALLRALRAVLHAPETWARRWTGRDEAEYFRSIEKVITFMEFSMEKKHDE
jgi:hypothetical protein